MREKEKIGKKNIEWASRTYNPITGCRGPVVEDYSERDTTQEKHLRITPKEDIKQELCPGCYAYVMARRLAGRSGYPKEDFFAPTL